MHCFSSDIYGSMRSLANTHRNGSCSCFIGSKNQRKLISRAMIIKMVGLESGLDHWNDGGVWRTLVLMMTISTIYITLA